MKCKLEDMSLEELWQLFPIELVESNPEWIIIAEDEISLLRKLFNDYQPVVITHIGSTAIPDIMAKPIVDILVEVKPEVDWDKIKVIMEGSGYICMSESGRRVSFNKGYTPSGYAEKVFHIHFSHLGDNDEICFRDYLIAHPDVAKEYEMLKMSLLPEYRHNRDGYTEAKTAFVRKIVELAKGC